MKPLAETTAPCLAPAKSAGSVNGPLVSPAHVAAGVVAIVAVGLPFPLGFVTGARHNFSKRESRAPADHALYWKYPLRADGSRFANISRIVLV